MSSKNKNIKNYLYDDSISLRQRLFVFSTLTVVSLLVVELLELVFTGTARQNILILVVLTLFIVIVSVISVKAKVVDLGAEILCGIMSFAYFPVSFIYGGGIEGDAPLWFLLNMILINVLLKGGVKVVFYVLESLAGVGCYMVAILSPQTIVANDYLTGNIHSLIGLTLISIAFGIILRIENTLYIRENQKAEAQKKEIEQLSASQNRFFSSMSHEIRTPINTIIGLNEMILREDVSDEVAEDAVNIRIAGKLLLNLINDILDMSKFQAGDMHLLIEPYSTGNMLSDLVGMLWIRAKEKKLEFHVNVAPDIPSELLGDEVRIKQVLMNVLNNAIKYTKEGSVSLSVECQKMDDGRYNMIYTVEDTGMGIKKEDIPYLFTAYRRVDESNTRHIEGTGLGLSIVKQLLDLMGGKVTVNSVYTKGSTFVIEIPQKATEEKPIGEYDYEKSHKLGRRSSYKQKFEAPEGKILVVDDNRSNLLVVTKLLRDTKLRIDTAMSGEEALNCTLNETYHMIFMDHLMPEMDGIECFRAIRNQIGGKCKEVPVVVLTANAGEENREIYAREGFDGYLVKPVSGVELENEVYRFLPKDIVKVTGDGEIVEETISWMKATQKKKRIAITTESVADLPRELLARYDIAILPHKVKTGEGTFKDGEEIDTSGIIAYMENPENKVEPIPPGVEEHLEFFAEQLSGAYNVIHIAVSSQIENSSYEAAMEAAGSFDNVFVVDSGHVSGGQGLVTLAACYMAASKMSVEDILENLNKFKKKIHSGFVVSDLDYLARSGHVGFGVANVVKSVMARPVITVKKGQMKIGGVYYGNQKKVWKKYIDACLSGSKIDDRVLFVIYAGLNKKDLEWIQENVYRKKPFKEIYFRQTSPAIASNCGPGTFGLLWMDK